MALLFLSGRPASAGIAGALSFTSITLAHGLAWRALLGGAAMWLVTMFGFVLNDVLDYRKDAAAGVERPIATGRIARRTAMVYGAALLAAMAAVALWVGSGWRVLALTAAALVAYTPFARRVPLLKGVYVAALCLLPLAYAASVKQQSLSVRGCVVLMLFVAGREVLMDAHEVAGDWSAGMATVAVLLGADRARRLGVALMAAGLLALVWAARGPWGKGFAVLANVLLAAVLGWRHMEEGRRIELSRLPMLAAALAVATA